MSILLEYTDIIIITCIFLSSITVMTSSLMAIAQEDIKKIIAYSTMSQLAQEYISYSNIFRHQTICVKTIILIIIVNSQITKARDYYNHYNFKIFNSSTIIRLLQYINYVLIR